MFARPHIFRHILHLGLSFIIALQFSLPAFAQANMSGYLCNPGGQAPSAQAQTQIKALLQLAGKDMGEDPSDKAHEPCCGCLGLVLAVLPEQALPTQKFVTTRQAEFNVEAFGAVPAHGPPLGSRAPPFFK